MQDTCKAAFAAGSNPGIRPSMMCAANAGRGTCHGDSGGPLFDANMNVLVGITSWGIGCVGSSPNVLSRIANQWVWVQTTICSDHSNPKPDFCNKAKPSSKSGKKPTKPSAPKPVQ